MDAAIQWLAGTATFTQQVPAPDPYRYMNLPQWKEPPADPIADALKAAGDAAAAISDNARAAARGVLNLLAEFDTPEVSVEGTEITFEWYKDRQHVAVIAVDGIFVTWAAMLGAANPVKGRAVFNNKLPHEAVGAVRAAR